MTKPRVARRAAVILTVVTVVLLVAAFVCGLLRIWGGDDRWEDTAWLLCLAGFVTGFAAGMIATEL